MVAFPVWRRLFILLCIILSSASCQAGATPRAASTEELRSQTAQTVIASETPESVPLTTSASDNTAEPVRTNAPVVTTEPVKCFITSGGAPIAFMPDSRMLAIKERSGVKLFDLESMEEETFLQAPQDLEAAALSPDGELLAWSLVDNTIQLVQVADQKLVKSINVHEMPVLKLIFSSKGDRLFSASYDTWVRTWDHKGQQLDAFQPTAALDLPNEIEAIAISPDDTLLGSVPFDGPTKVWDLAKKKEVTNLGNTGGDVTSDIAFSADGKYVAVNTLGRLSLWTITDWKMVWDQATVSAFAFSPDSHVLAYSEMEDESSVIFHPLVDLAKNTYD